MESEPLDRSPTAAPLWVQVEQHLRQRIANGEFVQMLPTEMELVDHYDVSRPTIRQAIASLVDDRLISRKPGRGSEILTPRIEQTLPGSFSLAHAISAAGHIETSHVIAIGLEHPPQHIAEQLEIPTRALGVHVERVRYADDAPVAVDRSWLPAPVGSSLLEADLSRGSVYDRLVNAGHRPTAGVEHIEPVIPRPDDRKHLQLRAGVPALEVTRLLHAGSRPIEHRTSTIRPDRYKLVNRWGDAPTIDRT